MEVDSVLAALSSADRPTRMGAESLVWESDMSPALMDGFLTRLSDTRAALAQRQLCATLVKELIRKRWSELSDSIKLSVLSTLARLTFEPNTSVRALCHAATALGASRVGISSWPELVSVITQGLHSSSPRSEQERGWSLDLLTEIIEECGGSAFGPQLAQEVSSALLTVSSSSQSLVLSRKAFLTTVSLLVNLARDEETTILSSLNIVGWVEVAQYLAKSTEVKNIISLLRGLKQLLDSGLESIAFPLIAPLLSESIVWLDSSRQTFESLVVLAEEGGIDEPDEEGGLTTLVVAICEFVNAIALNDISAVVLNTSALSQFLTAVSAFLQISISAEQEWLANPNEFIANEQDDFPAVSIRLAYEGLIADLLDNPAIPPHAIAADVIASSVKLLEVGMRERGNENTEWWRLVEAGLFAIGLLGGHTAGSGLSEILRGAGALCADPNIPILLRGRSFLLLARMQEVVCVEFAGDINGLVKSSISAMQEGNSLIFFAACKSLNACLEAAIEGGGGGVVRAVTGENGAFATVVAVAEKNDEETLHFCLETLIHITRLCPSTIHNHEEMYFQFLSKCLRERADDPLAPSELLDLVQIVAACVDRHCFTGLANELARVIKPWLVESAYSRLDTALEFMLVLVEHTAIPLEADMLECVQRVNNPQLAEIGPETANQITEILSWVSHRTSDSNHARMSFTES